ncbi:MSMEG_0569 family flavin-dependent oxidoreductase [Bradyrhizobium sp. CCGUVB23]|uniref:MSMEG_0569 family flavin-dependent oxidoreductase n=1 Tax=Bradyrhizobium sp. CCGUVB23 TaxID=2949630 RepID=UPI0020B387CA|nr:MSMEG_0569 family flavin-dependent oxidoreductase [Bradyrhizobium sp. CCGUVB23]MCP3467310.1 MSMEG_0569 family flavin-dependent oxidoreductase [Bradyrhizobium sp. CCGUVB23]
MSDLHTHYPVVVIGGGQAGLAMSAQLKKHGIGHVVLEKNTIAHSWKTQRWDAFCLVTPNWQCQLPGFPYAGKDPHGFMLRDEIVSYIEDFARHTCAPVREGVAVTRLRQSGRGFMLETTAGEIAADRVVLAVSGYHVPKVPPFAERLDSAITQIHSSAYRNPDQLPPGEILVVGSGQSGCQIAEDLHLAGRKVHLAVGSAPRCPRFYRGRDAVDWLDDLGQYDLPVEQHSLKEGVGRNANHYLTGRDGGRDVDLRKFALEGMKLYGRLRDGRGTRLQLGDDLQTNLDNADRVYNGICRLIDEHIAKNGIAAPVTLHYEPVWSPTAAPTELDLAASGITSIIWTTGFRSDWSWVDLPMFDGTGYPTHKRGITSIDGAYVIGLPWLYTWGSGRFVGIGRDAEFVADHIKERSSESHADTHQAGRREVSQYAARVAV